ncbi:MAG TPA: 3-oxoacyl-ACP reductase family protein [Polyangiaceae bacterium]|nr:3-oxoacyl-ACP reductase family protein [Polyangiaceae bacterium]
MTPDASFPNFRLDGQLALVTGAARGIGRACALALASAGADVALGLHELGDDGDLVREIEALGRRAFPLQMDLSRLDEVRAAVESAASLRGRLDVLVNNVGIGAPNPALEVTEQDFDATIAVNLKGTFFASQSAARLMIPRRYGRIVNISSQAGFVALPTESVYCMSKAAISHLTKCFALEWAAHGITVNAVAPTFIRTPGTRKWLDDQAFLDSVLARIPLGRVGEPSDVASAVLYLASPAASLVTGATLMMDGGWTVQ